MKSKQFNDLKSIRERVSFLLESNPLLRDNDMRLIATYYFNVIGKDAINEMSALQLLTDFGFNKLPCFESIKRIRVMIQKENESLRGTQYKVRKKKLPNWFLVDKKD
jgi:hypothetical protein